MPILIIIIIISAFFRLYGLNWDQGQHLHPDERMITMVADRINLTNLNPKFFAYGSFPIYLLHFTGNLADVFNPTLAHYDRLNLVGRAFSALFDLGTLTILYFLGIKLASKGAGLLAALFYGVAVLPIQLSHFYAVDTLLTFFTITCLYLLVLFSEKPSLRKSLFIGITFGFALATKTSALLLAFPIFITL